MDFLSILWIAGKCGLGIIGASAVLIAAVKALHKLFPGP